MQDNGCVGAYIYAALVDCFIMKREVSLIYEILKNFL